MDMKVARAKLGQAARGDTLKLRQRCDRRRSAMLDDRAVWVPDWMQVAEYVDPAQGQFEGLADGARKPKRSKADATVALGLRL